MDYVIWFMLFLFPLSLYVCGMCSGTDTEYRNVWTYYSSDVAMILSEAGKIYIRESWNHDF